MIFRDRAYAGQRLAELLKPEFPISGYVVAIPRGGVPVALEIARALNLPLRLIFIRKIGHPINPEYAIGAVSDTNELLLEYKSIGQETLNEIKSRERKRIDQMIQAFGNELKSNEARNKTILLVDDGIATGTCIELAIHCLRAMEVKSIWVTVPVSSLHGAKRIRSLSDKFFCLHESGQFTGIGAFYIHFEQLTDAQVREMLTEIRN